jgi:hypothetical protein
LPDFYIGAHAGLSGPGFCSPAIPPVIAPISRQWRSSPLRSSVRRRHPRTERQGLM